MSDQISLEDAFLGVATMMLGERKMSVTRAEDVERGNVFIKFRFLDDMGVEQTLSADVTKHQEKPEELLRTFIDLMHTARAYLK
jgi:hypothetical protein